MSKLSAGTYSAKIVDCGFRKTKAGKDQVFIEFEATDVDGRATWFGSLNVGKAQEITLKTMLESGFNGNWDKFGSAEGLECFDVSKVFSIVLEDEEFKGKTFTKIKWINNPDGPGAQQKLNQSEATRVVNSMNLKAATMTMKQTMGIQAPASKPATKKAVNSDVSLDEEFPF